MKNYTIIYNPAAGQGLAGQRMPAVTEQLDASDLDYTLLKTEGPGHAIELAREAGEKGGVHGVVAAGGDGTANEVINGLMQAKASGARIPALGVLCVGRGNDFAYGAGLPGDLTAGVEALVSGDTATIDVGLLKGGVFPDGRYFGNGIGIGFDTIVGFEAAKMKRIKGFAGYVIGALKTLILYYKFPVLTIRTDAGEVSRPCIQVSVMNGQRMGGAFYMAPRALSDDGYLDLSIAGTPNRRAMLGLVVKYLKGSQEGSPHITMERTRTFTVTSNGEPLAIHADGETVSQEEHTTLEVQCIAGALQVIRGSEALRGPRESADHTSA